MNSGSSQAQDVVFLQRELGVLPLDARNPSKTHYENDDAGAAWSTWSTAAELR